jgi:UDP-N-acetylglucosamine--N-acetylmuramyl-(pentapeptide) pyrophosphoryl-undecaprenol N-acetylglucosamine transferase
MHQVGEHALEALRAAYAALDVHADCRVFIDDMAAALAEADLVICRAGAMTVAEVAAVGAAALFVPFPYATDDHQTVNARYLTAKDAGWVCSQTALTAQWLADWLQVRKREELQAVAQRARAAALPHAAQRIADICESVVTTPRGKG